MLVLAIIVFVLAALLGLYLASFILTNKNTPKGVALIHGGFALLGVLLLIGYSLMYDTPVWALVFFVLATMGGVFMVYLDLTGKTIAKVLPLGHGLIAAVGLVLLILYVYQGHSS
ncbi:hypothetical protein DIZ81_05365 [Legionella taurinensis]|uniref:Uncharacterized protein n=1 Tax=Legionella taurinensis TaxID=70611 RepID=A0A3A5L8K4_9GAMM|nr:hypothetical protein [Legionella taurinensis]MDX1837341.1 hypothetical protein [Legionella taurinensis]PUT40696.1 hypothetical protein DB744_05365 [Legionella taurinensis]PUT44118.1 hypothetical protein DB746_03765 [Legionella taurinensis]PUT47419.1 hypothetical protein DB743_01935 [Legionella taurinensis]PUT48558.1 hypothetical protein DB745_03765 [Legionella taurinensis]